jgi:hypothetical protein
LMQPRSIGEALARADREREERKDEGHQAEEEETVAANDDYEEPEVPLGSHSDLRMFLAKQERPAEESPEVEPPVEPVDYDLPEGSRHAVPRRSCHRGLRAPAPLKPEVDGAVDAGWQGHRGLRAPAPLKHVDRVRVADPEVVTEEQGEPLPPTFADLRALLTSAEFAASIPAPPDLGPNIPFGERQIPLALYELRRRGFLKDWTA